MSGPVDVELRSYTIGFARVSVEGLFAGNGLEAALDTSWRPGKSVVRYGRQWKLSRELSATPGTRIGRIGFVNERELSTLFYDEKANDFARGVAQSGVVVPFGISTSDGTVAYQLRSGIVRETTFTGALQALLNADSGEYLWRVDPLAESTPYEDWIARISRVTNFDVRLERPNPHYYGNDLAEQIIEEIRLEFARLSGTERPGEGVDTNADPFRQAMDHVLRDYGRASLRALDPQGEESVWVKARGRLGSVLIRRKRQAVGPEDAPLDIIRDAVNDIPSAAEVVPGDGDGTPSA